MPSKAANIQVECPIDLKPLPKPSLTPIEIDLALAHIADRFDRYWKFNAARWDELDTEYDSPEASNKRDEELQSKFGIPKGVWVYGDDGQVPWFPWNQIRPLVKKWLQQKETALEGMRIHDLLTDFDAGETDWMWILFDKPHKDATPMEIFNFERLLYLDKFGPSAVASRYYQTIHDFGEPDDVKASNLRLEAMYRCEPNHATTMAALTGSSHPSMASV